MKERLWQVGFMVAVVVGILVSYAILAYQNEKRPLVGLPVARQAPVSPVAAQTNSLVQWCSAMENHGTRMATCTNAFSVLCSNPRFQDRSWEVALKSRVREMGELAREGQAIVAPAEFSGIQANYNLAMREFEYVSRVFPGAMDSQDVAAILECARRIETAGEYISRATAELCQVMSERGISK